MKWTALLTLLALPAAAQDLCQPDPMQSAAQHLRRLSLDLRGRLPTYTETLEVVEAGGLPADAVDAALDSPGFLHQIREYHRDLLWANLARQRLANNVWQLRPNRRADGAGDGPPLYVLPGQPRQLAYRNGRVACRNVPATFNPDGSIAFVEEPDPNDPANTVRREGYVEVAPYWAPGTRVRVCAFDAQTNAQGTNPRNGRQVSCTQGVGAPECGCGPNLQWCFTQETELEVTTAMTEQTLETLERLVAEDRPYTDAILGTRTVVNGPLVHYYRHQTTTGGNFIAASPDPGFPLPDRDFTQAGFVEVETGPEHAGILTLPGFMMRFQSDRGRANRFYQAFLCQNFQAPEGGLPAADDVCQQEPDLTERCGCEYCHQTLEPAAAAWGRWAQAGIMHLDADTFPRFNAVCADERGVGNAFCRRFYLTEPGHPKEEPYRGHLLAYVFADEHPERLEIIDEGPRGLAEEAVASGRFALCTTTKLWTWLMGRPPRPDENPIVGELASTFAADGHRLKGLVKAIVSRPEYVAAGLFGEEVQ